MVDTVAREVHVVRCRPPPKAGEKPDPDIWVDVKIIDKIVFRTVNGDEFLYDCSALNAQPYIKDEVGAGVGTGNPDNCSRVSHMTRLSDGAKEPAYAVFIEVLDAVALRGPNGDETVLSMPNSLISARIRDEHPDSDLPSYAFDPGPLATRSDTIQVMFDFSQGETDEGKKLCLVVRNTKAVSFLGPNGQEGAFVFGGDAEKDNTNYTTDENDNQIPPDNNDPNPYAVIPTGVLGPTVSPMNTDLKTAVAAPGILWQIIGASSQATRIAVFEIEIVYHGVNTTPNPSGAMKVTQLDLPGAALPYDAIDGHEFSIPIPGATDTPPILEKISNLMLTNYLAWGFTTRNWDQQGSNGDDTIHWIWRTTTIVLNLAAIDTLKGKNGELTIEGKYFIFSADHVGLVHSVQLTKYKGRKDFKLHNSPKPALDPFNPADIPDGALQALEDESTQQDGPSVGDSGTNAIRTGHSTFTFTYTVKTKEVTLRIT